MNKPSTFAPGPILIAALAGALALLTGCAGVPTTPTAPAGATFYPALPDPPRIQHLATFSSARDVDAPRTGLADFVLGEEGTENTLRQPYGAALFQGKIYVADSRAPVSRCSTSSHTSSRFWRAPERAECSARST